MVRMAVISSSGGASLRRNPLAPARNDPKTLSSSEKVVRTRIRTASPHSATMRPVAAMPSRRGIRRSMRTTSGSSRRACRMASSPSTASPTTTKSGTDSSSLRKPARTSAWSSHTRIRVLMSLPARRACARRPRTRCPVPPVGRDCRRTERPAPASRSGRGPPRPGAWPARPSSAIRRPSSVARYRMSTRTWVPPEWRTALVRASCTIR